MLRKLRRFPLLTALLVACSTTEPRLEVEGTWRAEFSDTDSWTLHLRHLDRELVSGYFEDRSASGLDSSWELYGELVGNRLGLMSLPLGFTIEGDVLGDEYSATLQGFAWGNGTPAPIAANFRRVE